MIYSTIKIVVLTILLIIIIHLFICYLLMNQKKKKVHFNLEEETIPSTNNSDEPTSIVEDENHKDKFDLNLMKNDLMKYISSNKEIYKEKKSNTPSPNSNCVDEPNAKLSNDNSSISQYFSNTVNTNDISLYEEPKEKQVYIDDTPQIVSKTMKPIDNEFNNSNDWKYHNENVMNGGEFSNGLVGYETIGGQFATLD